MAAKQTDKDAVKNPDTAADAPDFADIAGMSYEQARTELIGVVQGLENPEAPLEDTMQLWDRGEALAGHCQKILDAAAAKLAARQAESA
ncbi:exodeoxyribonuclease VII small subunit [Mobiluncus mulieris]|uniref:Exodeoxyribonuclease VII small subunit n=2 Tax=Mobiluncus mulieris TaxID=2052 RepID=E0QNE1_9ACTO|nr:exodeoxyribonuclease VII small subunit [Mobiluncus mulieris]EEJ53038.1 exodeoxyribonuclease VII, small subunit [Mobiluncus mulieris ATCC 35243]EFM46913.1 exodeoxyribonuclease VII, small subunit [Mobiluncus mulieris ATCC 35239]EFN94052.1 exodeoxyribonuclease VII, small subunit [Mobiluncus mulieris FB024-16]MCU9970584.1 exodeoxyribonuclease VII small subunit [Mobiluncus mulieris]MCU9995862.1 exodeoxyribonuclease VII small subunit [Mobiluncus mulieris]